MPDAIPLHVACVYMYMYVSLRGVDNFQARIKPYYYIGWVNHTPGFYKLYISFFKRDNYMHVYTCNYGIHII